MYVIHYIARKPLLETFTVYYMSSKTYLSTPLNLYVIMKSLDYYTLALA